MAHTTRAVMAHKSPAGSGAPRPTCPASAPSLPHRMRRMSLSALSSLNKQCSSSSKSLQQGGTQACELRVGMGGVDQRQVASLHEMPKCSSTGLGLQQLAQQQRRRHLLMRSATSDSSSFLSTIMSRAISMRSSQGDMRLVSTSPCSSGRRMGAVGECWLSAGRFPTKERSSMSKHPELPSAQPVLVCSQHSKAQRSKAQRSAPR